MKALIGLTAGFFLGYIFQIPVDEKIFAVVMLAAIDSICGGFSAKLNSNFSDTILIVGFFTNLIFGLIFGLRIFKNISAAQELFLKK